MHRIAKILLLAGALALLFSTRAEAYFVATFNARLQPQLPTSVLVAGYPHGLGTRFLEAAVATGLRLRESHPERQIVIFVAGEESVSKAVFERLRLNAVEIPRVALSPKVLLAELKAFPEIAGIDFFTHTHPLWGAGLEGLRRNQRINHETPGLTALRGHFLPGAYVFFHGCNAGLVIAPAAARALDVPVIAALTSTSIERLASDGQWYEDDASRKDWAELNSVSFARPVPCAEGACVRMRPDNHPYQGKYGKFGVGLGYYKAFCPGSEEACGPAMAEALLGFPTVLPLARGSGAQSLEEVLQDFLCPSESHSAERAACALALGSGAEDMFLGKEPLCVRQGCSVSVSCAGTCRVDGDPDSGRLQRQDELHYYKTGWEQLWKRYR